MIIKDLHELENVDLNLPAPPTADFSELQTMVRLSQVLMNGRQPEHNRKYSGVTSPKFINAMDERVAYADKQIARLEQRFSDDIYEQVMG